MKKFSFFILEMDDLFEIYLFNLEESEALIKKHLVFFQKNLNTNKSPHEILKDILQSKNILKEGLDKSHSLYGMLLGFGKHNSTNFEQHCSDIKFLLKPRASFSTEPVISFLKLRLPDFSTFGGSEETAQLRRDYEEQRNRILKLYSSGDFLEVTLKGLTKK